MSIRFNFISQIDNLILNYLKSLNDNIDNVVSEIPPSNDLGDIAYPMFKYASILKIKPFDIATKVKEAISNNPLIEKVDIKGAYLNIFLNKKIVTNTLIKEILEKRGNFGKENRKNIKVLIEFSSPNTNKPLHLGHCRNNVIGDAISRIFDFYGYDVIKINLINDRGIHICKSMLAYKLFGNNTTPEKENKKSDHLVGDFYVLYAKESSKNPELEKLAQDLLIKWENNDKETVELWKKMNKWAIDGIKETYKRMGINFDVFEYESEVYQYGKEIVKEGLEKNVFYKESDGSIWVNNEDVGLDKKVLLRSDGTSIYITQDIGTIVNRSKKYNFDKMIYVVGSEQIYHFKTLFAILKKLGYKWADNCYHLSYGMVNLPDGKMKSREGNVVDADNLMDLLYKMAIDIIEEKNRELTEDEKKEIANKISLAALKYYLLNFSTIKDITFIPEKSISFDGNTGPYIQYTTARINSLLKKSGKYTFPETKNLNYQFNIDEWNLISQLLNFEESIKKAVENYSPLEICDFLYNTSKLYNKFYHEYPILTADEEVRNFRLALSEAILQLLKNGLNLLGIEPVEKM
ncbi:MAG TPA: arginine--tRNA ligase [Spirochaetota bacterium]|nr:arginine--tRNA ligase [Spirochaetota bacterium]HOL57905.1 arginine--tRNA ligase [Spirochaetota bacterium]